MPNRFDDLINKLGNTAKPDPLVRLSTNIPLPVAEALDELVREVHERGGTITKTRIVVDALIRDFGILTPRR